MKTLIIFRSYHHQNTERIVRAMAEILAADVVSATKSDNVNPKDYDRIGFASGIYFNGFDKTVFKTIDRFGPQPGKPAFLVCTAGIYRPAHTESVAKKLTDFGYTVLGTFACRGFDTWGPWKFVGGFNKGAPTEEDFAAARAFARSL